MGAPAGALQAAPGGRAEAFRELPELRLTMVGLGPLEEQLRAGLPPNVELRGWMPREELARLFAGSGGFIHVGEEDFGISMVEALAAGAPVVAADPGGLATSSDLTWTGSCWRLPTSRRYGRPLRRWLGVIGIARRG